MSRGGGFRMTTIEFSDHAVQRFVARHAPTMSFADGRRFLEAAKLVRCRERSVLGQELYEVPEPRCFLVVKRDRRMGISICVTVLPELPRQDAPVDVDPWEDAEDPDDLL